ncbi:MAG: aspartate aminotransferase [Pseudoalteromonas tetraodonis]|jgi:aspartate aminotransferase
MFDTLKALPEDPILGLSVAYKADTNPKKIDLGVGVYKDDNSVTPVMTSVKKAEQFLFNAEDSKAYLPPAGTPGFISAIEAQIFGVGHSALLENRVATIPAPGGSGALRVAAEFIVKAMPNARLWVSSPTWANHHNLLGSAGLEISDYDYYCAETKAVDFVAMEKALLAVPAGDVVLLHGCCHNPSGADLSPEQWKRVADIANDKGWLPFIDTAYHGLGDGLDEDGFGMRYLAANVSEMIIANSCSKNYGLYRERTGSTSIVSKSPAAAAIARSHMCFIARGIYSMPPAHGFLIVETINQSAELKAEWIAELAEMRGRINGLRKLFLKKVQAQKIAQDFSAITQQKGMFSFLGITPEQVAKLKSDYAIYMVGSSRVNVAGITVENVDYLAASIKTVVEG